MTEPMSLARFQTLADAYGSVVDRWPVEEVAAARALAREPSGRAILTQASALDEALDAWRMPGPDGALAARVIATADDRRRRVARHLRLWWSGLGIATALAGAAAGTATAAVFTPTPEPIEAAGAFGDLGSDQGT